MLVKTDNGRAWQAGSRLAAVALDPPIRPPPRCDARAVATTTTTSHDRGANRRADDSATIHLVAGPS